MGTRPVRQSRRSGAVVDRIIGAGLIATTALATFATGFLLAFWLGWWP